MTKSGFIFDLDGVLVDTARHHFDAWQAIADDLGFRLDPSVNERIKGVSRMESLDIVLAAGNVSLSAGEKQKLAETKNRLYVSLISEIGPGDLLPNVEEFLRQCRLLGIGTAVGSASKNAPLIIDRLGIGRLLDAVVDGTVVHRAKPDPEVFTAAAAALSVDAAGAVVFEDAAAGILAAHRAGMFAVGIGLPRDLHEADIVIRSLDGLSPLSILCQRVGVTV